MSWKMVEAWAVPLSQKLGRSPADIVKSGLSAYDFGSSSSVQIEFGDGSNCTFKYAFCVLDEEKLLLAVFTEHCGYHEFSVRGAAVWEIGADRVALVDDR